MVILLYFNSSKKSLQVGAVQGRGGLATSGEDEAGAADVARAPTPLQEEVLSHVQSHLHRNLCDIRRPEEDR